MSKGIILLVFLGVLFFIIQTSDNPNNPSLPDRPLNIASYNMQIFGESKLSDPNLMKDYRALISKYDIFFVQEIRDSSGVAFKELCDSLNYQCLTSSRAGRSSSKEQYGVMWNNRSQVVSTKDFNLLNYSDEFERPPLKVIMQLNKINMSANGTLNSRDSINVSFFIIHTKPTDAQNEIKELEELVYSDPDFYKVVLGDLNMDCDYYPESGSNFGGYTSFINSDQDTTVGLTNCAYDRIFVSPPFARLVTLSGIDTNTNSKMSDHYPIFFQV